MTEDEFLALGRAGYNRIPLHLETLADLDTPLSIYLKLANRPGSYLLESVIGGERFGRYSIVGLPARERLEVSGNAGFRHARRRKLPAEGGGRSARIHRRLPAIVSRRAARAGAALRRRARRLFRLRHRALHRKAAAGNLEARSARSSRDPPAPFRRARGGGQPLGKLHLIVYADPAKPGAYARATRRLKELRVQLRKPAELPAHEAAGFDTGGAAIQHRRGGVPRGGGAMQALHHRRRHDAGADLAAHHAAVPVFAGEPLPVAALDQSRRPTCSISTSAIASWWAPRPRSWCDARATR